MRFMYMYVAKTFNFIVVKKNKLLCTVHVHHNLTKTLIRLKLHLNSFRKHPNRSFNKNAIF